MDREVYANLDGDDGDGGDDALADDFRALVLDASEIGAGASRLLARVRGVVAWKNDDAALDHAGARGLPLWGSRGEIVRHMSDRAWLVDVSHRRQVDPGISDFAVALDVDEIDTTSIEAVVQRWPAFARAQFAVIPRRGDLRVVHGSGAARFRYDNEEGLAIFRQRGGAVVTPWPARRSTFASAWLVDEHGEPHCVARTDESEQALDKARAVVDVAAHRGYRGACSVEGFTWKPAHDDDVRVCGAAALRVGFSALHVRGPP